MGKPAARQNDQMKEILGFSELLPEAVLLIKLRITGQNQIRKFSSRSYKKSFNKGKFKTGISKSDCSNCYSCVTLDPPQKLAGNLLQYFRSIEVPEVTGNNEPEPEKEEEEEDEKQALLSADHYQVKGER